MVTKEEFNKVWNESTTEDILNQFYYEHNDLREMLKENGNKEEVIKRQQEVIDQLTNNWNELEECVESRLMSIPDDICTNEVEEARRTTKIAVYQVILGKMKEIKEGKK